MISDIFWQIKAIGLQSLSLSAWLVALICVFVPLERFFGLHPYRILRKQIWIDAAWYFINSIFPALLFVPPLMMLSHALDGADPGGLYTMVSRWPLWLKILATLLVSDIGAYWAHRAFHAWPPLWRLHAVHHSAEEMDWLVNTRAHPFEIVLTRLCGFAPVYLLGLAHPQRTGVDSAILWLQITGTAWTFYIHANIRWRLGPVEWLVTTPAFHHWHHTTDEHRNHNYAFIFPFIDKIFGTAWLPGHWPPAYGIRSSMPTTLVGQLLDPLAVDVCRPQPKRAAPELDSGAGLA